MAIDHMDAKQIPVWCPDQDMLEVVPLRLLSNTAAGVEHRRATKHLPASCLCKNEKPYTKHTEE